MTNPLAARRAANDTPVKTDLAEWCAENNAKPIFAKMSRWYFVTTNDGEDLIDSLQGSDADNLRKMLDGEVIEFVGWPESRMEGYRRWLSDCARRGGYIAPALEKAA